jgi:molybdopterin-guanine dinucleotide biosynthesis protein
VEIFGPEASGKTTLAMHVIAEAQKEGGILYRELLATNALTNAYKHSLDYQPTSHNFLDCIPVNRLSLLKAFLLFNFYY